MTYTVDAKTVQKVMEKWLPGDDKDDEHQKTGTEHLKLNDAEDGENATAVFDKAVLMEQMMDDEELVQTIINAFLEDIPKQIEALKGYLEAGDAAGAERQAHTIKGASANVGGEALREIAFSMEKAGKAGEMERIKALMGDMLSAFEQLREKMERVMGQA